jgi:hypothetical protein
VLLNVADQIFYQPRRLLLADPILFGVALAGVSEFSPVER